MFVKAAKCVVVTVAIGNLYNGPGSGVKGEKSLEIIVHVVMDLRRVTVLGLDLTGWVKGQ